MSDVTDEQSDENGFSYTFGTLEGHVEAGEIKFSASQDKKGNITFGINSTSKVDYGAYNAVGKIESVARSEQAKSWQEVLTNAVKYLQGTEVKRSTSVQKQKNK